MCNNIIILLDIADSLCHPFLINQNCGMPWKWLVVVVFFVGAETLKQIQSNNIYICFISDGQMNGKWHDMNQLGYGENYT